MQLPMPQYLPQNRPLNSPKRNIRSSPLPSTMLRIKLGLGLVLVLLSVCITVEPKKCSRGCELALGSYYVQTGSDFTLISKLFSASIEDILGYNPEIRSRDVILNGSRINVPFTCDCIAGEFLGHVFDYEVQKEDTYGKVARVHYANLTTEDWLQRFNGYSPNRIPDTDARLNVTVNCSCGDRSVSRDYGLFVTYPVQPGESWESIAGQMNLSVELLEGYNRNVNFSAGSALLYIPGKDKNGKYPPLKFSAGLSGGIIAAISAAGVAVTLFFALCAYFGFRFYRKNDVQDTPLLTEKFGQQPPRAAGVSGQTLKNSMHSTGLAGGVSSGLTGITVDNSVEFSYEELAQATDQFSMANKIGEGGYGSVYYAVLRNQKAAIKKMETRASKAFFAELKILTHVHHVNLVRLIGYCIGDNSLFLVYEYIENGSLKDCLHSSVKDPLPWSTRVQIALDSARGLEYIHEHTVPVYIHRDIKSANILVDKRFQGKVADFGLTKLAEVGSASHSRGFAGTFGYMPPEYTSGCNISPKVDVYAFGVVLCELISAMDAVVWPNGHPAESKGLAAIFREVLNQPDPREELYKMVDPRLGDNYPFDSVLKMAQLANACTHENPQLRPSMKNVMVALLTLSSSTENWDMESFLDNPALLELMSGR